MGYVYFVEAPGYNFFKIGRTLDLKHRMITLSTSCPLKIRLFGVIKSDDYRKVEKRLHNRLDKYRLDGYYGRPNEWFRISRKEARLALFGESGIICLYRHLIESWQRDIEERIAERVEKRLLEMNR